VDDDSKNCVLIPAGEFKMGSTQETGAGPVHTVYLDAYSIGRFEVTNGQYKRFMDDGGYTDQSYWAAGGFNILEGRKAPFFWNNESYHGGGVKDSENYPVGGVSWYEAMAYCNWLSKKSGKAYRLPTEAEWEKAARGTTTRVYPWGDEIDHSWARYYDYLHPLENDPQPVGFFGCDNKDRSLLDNASPYGVYDMAGNMREWCSDWYSLDYYSKAPQRNPKGPDKGIYKVVRGGAWNSIHSSDLHVCRRDYYLPIYIYDSYGFRCVLEAHASR
jgi:formylglycine-generating enzyme required for sulfatase activity